MRFTKIVSLVLFFFASTAFAVAGGNEGEIIVYGKASYYAKSLNNRFTASGERHRSDSLVCAHKSFPFGTLLKVTNLRNGQEVIVKVNDRGPFIKGRIIDLSFRAAKDIGMLSSGVVEVKVEVFHPNENNPFETDSTSTTNAQTGSFQ
jgi:rare lipoprotein A